MRSFNRGKINNHDPFLLLLTDGYGSGRGFGDGYNGYGGGPGGQFFLLFSLCVLRFNHCACCPFENTDKVFLNVLP